MDADTARRRLEKILRATVSSDGVSAAGFWVGDTSGQRRVFDDFQAGRLAWLGAHQSAKRGLDALASGDLELAELLVWQANDFLLDALWSRMGAEDIAFLSQSAERRGRKLAMSDRDIALLQAVASQERLGLKGKAARRAAFAQNGDLALAFRGISDDGIRKAIARAQKRLGPTNSGQK